MLTVDNVAPGWGACDSRIVSVPATSKARLAPVIPIPVFENHQKLLVDWFERIEQVIAGRGRAGQIIPAVAAVCQQLRRVRHSARHARLAQLLEPALLALHDGELEGAQGLLLNALAAFGWPSHVVD
jgi:hypothetical protein